ncbi:MAG: alginate lyase family protein [Pedobacter sp.]|nr:alginate lyase family protein [Pedobacter sp.]
MKFIFIVLLLFSRAFAQDTNLSLLNPILLASKRNAYKNGDVQLVKQVQMVLKNADKFLSVNPESVMDKALSPTSKSKHDYMSMAPYWWPDTTKQDGLPYIRKDGVRNPIIKKITDHEFLGNLENRCKFLSLAYYFTSEEKYADKAQQLLNVWFLNPATKMNPNLDYAQAIPGRNDGRGNGIIESRALVNIADWVCLLNGAKSFTNSDKDGIKAWYKDYLNWMLTSKNGIEESKSKNNHGTHYDAQIASFSIFIGDFELAKNIVTAAKKRIDIQIDSNGKQPLELERTNAYSYSTMNLDGWFNLAMVGNKVGVDLWNYQAESLKKAINWLLPYALEEQPRTYKQLINYNSSEMYKLLMIASAKYKGNYAEKSKRIPLSDKVILTRLLYQSK